MPYTRSTIRSKDPLSLIVSSSFFTLRYYLVANKPVYKTRELLDSQSLDFTLKDLLVPRCRLGIFDTSSSFSLKLCSTRKTLGCISSRKISKMCLKPELTNMYLR